MLNRFPQMMTCSQYWRRRLHCAIRRPVRPSIERMFMPPFKSPDQLREELKEEFGLTDEQLDQMTMYLL